MKNLIIHFFLILFTASVFSQTKSEMAVYNIGLGSVFGGIGALINKKPSEKTGAVLIKGIWQGAMGGYLIYESKNLLSNVSKKEKWSYAWGAKFVNAAGVSIVENAASNRDFWEQWNLHFGFNRVELYTKEKIKLKYKLLPLSFVFTVITATKSEFKSSYFLKTGEIIFSHKDLLTSNNWRGYTLGNIIVIDENSINDYFVLNHELFHVFQYYDYNFINSYKVKWFKTLSSKNLTFGKLNSFFYFDLQSPFMSIVRGTFTNYSNADNFFEYEAQFYTTNN